MGHEISFHFPLNFEISNIHILNLLPRHYYFYQIKPSVYTFRKCAKQQKRISLKFFIKTSIRSSSQNQSKLHHRPHRSPHIRTYVTHDQSLLYTYTPLSLYFTQHMEQGVYDKVAEYLSLMGRTELLTCMAMQNSFGKIRDQAQQVSSIHIRAFENGPIKRRLSEMRVRESDGDECSRTAHTQLLLDI